MIDQLSKAFDALLNDFLGYEFVVRENLSSLYFNIYRLFEHEIKIGDTGLNQDHQRIIKMIDYIHKNYFYNIGLTEIASLCGFDSSSNFSKLFKRFYNCTPSEYRNSRK